MAQAQQNCTQGVSYKQSTLQCNFNINSVPGNRTISLSVVGSQDDAKDHLPYEARVKVELLRGSSVVKSWVDNMTVTVGPVGDLRYDLNKTYAYKKGGLGQYNYVSKVSMDVPAKTTGRLTVTSNR